MSKLKTIDINCKSNIQEIGNSFVIQIENDSSYRSIMNNVKVHISELKNVSF